MAVKTITIDMAAYSLLKAEKKNSESFSKVIKRRLKPENTAMRLLAELDTICLEKNTLDSIEQIVKDRSLDYIDSPDIEHYSRIDDLVIETY